MRYWRAEIKVFCLASAMTLTACQANFSIGYKDGTSPLSRILAAKSTTTSSTTVSPAVTVTGNAAVTLIDQTDDDNSVAGFGGASMVGLTWDGSKVVLDSSGTPTNNAELDASWAPKWTYLVGLWHLNESALGTAPGGLDFADASAYGNHGSKAGAFAVGGTGKLANSGTIAGVGYVSIPDSPSLQVPTEITILSWIKFNGAFPAEAPIFQKDWPNEYNFELVNAIPYLYVNGMVPAAGGGGHAVLSGTWTQVGVTYDGISVKTYIDDNLTSTTPAVGGISLSAGAATIGDCCGNFQGQFDEVAVWNKALTPAEIQVIYSRQSAQFSGLLTSRVLDATATATWSDITWKSTLPFFKGLPDGGNANSESSTAYSSLVGSTGSTSDNNLMSGIVGLWHLNETAATAGVNNDFIDQSGNGGTGEQQNGVAFGAQGILSNSVSLDGVDDWIDFIPTASLTALDYNSDFSTSIWVNIDPVQPFLGATTNTIAMMPTTLGYSFHLSFLDSAAGGFWGTVRFNRFDGTCGVGPVGGSVLDHKWHHVTAIKRGLNVELYIDAVLVAQAADCPPSPAQTVTGLYLSHFQPLKGELSEFAIWSRALNTTEITQLYRRGANRLKFQTRTCATNPCTVESWLGPDGTNQTYFSELHNTSVPTGGGLVLPTLPDVFFSAFGGLTVPSNRYFQYRAIFESDDSSVATSPDLQSVRVGPSR